MSQLLPSGISLQDLLELQGFIVVAYWIQEEIEEDDLRGHIGDRCEGSLYGCNPYPRIIGVATREDWNRQNTLSGDDDNEVIPYIAFRKVTAE